MRLEQPRSEKGWVELRASLEVEDALRTAIWFRVPESPAGHIDPTAAPFLLASLFFAMRHGCDVHVHGCVSPALLRSLDAFQAAWTAWLPRRYRWVEVTADTECEDERPRSDTAVLAFSGGLDSCFSAWRHARGRIPSGCKLVAGVMVHGFDIPLDDARGFELACENSRRILDSIGLDLIPVATNFRDLRDDWNDAHGAGLAACLHLAGGSAREGLVAASHSRDALRLPWGSNPITDPMLSTGAFRIHYDGVEFARHEKAAALSDWETGMARLRVCWEGEQRHRNCGNCLRCTATALCFAAAGVAPPAVLNVPSPAAAVERLRAVRLGHVQIARLRSLLSHARGTGREPGWAHALERFLRHRERKVALDAGMQRARRRSRKLWRRMKPGLGRGLAQ